MSKRMGFQFRQPRSKMPKLDITISSSQRIAVAGPSNLNQQRESTEAPAQSEDAWYEDEEDEIFVLASQAVEQVQANAAVVISQAMNTTDHDISYNRFRQNARTAQSTQLIPFDDFDNNEDIFSNVPDFIPNTVQPPQVTNHRENNGQMPSNPVVSQNLVRVPSDTSIKTRNEKEKIQNQYYAEKLKAQKKQIEQMKETLSKLNQKCTTKEGEASTLRYEVDAKSREIEKLRKERIEEAVDMETKFGEKITALEKKIEKQRTELEFKNVEILQKKSRRSLNDSVTVEQESSTSSFDLYQLFKLHTNHIGLTMSESANSSAAEFLAMKGLEKHRGLSERDFDTLNSLSALQAMYNGAKAKRLHILDNNMMKEFTIIANTLIDVLKIYTARLTLRAPTKYNPATEYKILSEDTTQSPNSPDESMNVDEKLIYETQALAVIALLCTDFANATESLLFDKCEESTPHPDEDDEMNGENRIGSFVDMLTDVLCAIGHSKSVSLHKSLIESASLLLVALAKSYSPTDLGDSLLLNLFQAIAFCEPELASLNHLSEFLALISENQSSNICNRFCTNETNNVMSIQRYKIHRFSIETCPLQVFSCLLQISFQPYGNNRSMSDHTNEVVTVTNITIRMIRFLRNCFNRRVEWLFRKSRNADDAPQISYCYCYVVSCIVVLLHFCINSWMENHKIIDLRYLQTISTMGALFLYDIIRKHYEPKVLNLGGFPVKNRLQAIYDWIESYHFLFRISTIPGHALNAVHLRRIPQMNEPQMVLTEPADPNKPTESRPKLPVVMDSILLGSFDDFLL